MAGRGKAPREQVVEKKPLLRGEPQSAVGVGWQHGDVPECPPGLMPAAELAWVTWLGAWFAAFWTPADVPGLRQMIRLYDQVERGEFHRAGELRLQMDTYGVTPKGQQDRRWKPPVEVEVGKVPVVAGGRYGHLQSVVSS